MLQDKEKARSQQAMKKDKFRELPHHSPSLMSRVQLLILPQQVEEEGISKLRERKLKRDLKNQKDSVLQVQK